jgi:hypothetical protein
VKSSYELKPGSVKSICLFYQNQSASLSRGLCFGFFSTKVKQRIELETLRLFRGFNVHKHFKNNKPFSYGRVPMLPVANNFSMPLSGDIAFTYAAMLARSGRRLFVPHCSRKYITPAQPHSSRLDITTALTIAHFKNSFCVKTAGVLYAESAFYALEATINGMACAICTQFVVVTEHNYDYESDAFSQSLNS